MHHMSLLNWLPLEPCTQVHGSKQSAVDDHAGGNREILDFLRTGVLDWRPLGPCTRVRYVAPGGPPPTDWVGLNYYSRVVMDWRCQVAPLLLLSPCSRGPPADGLGGPELLLARGRGLALPGGAPSSCFPRLWLLWITAAPCFLTGCRPVSCMMVDGAETLFQHGRGLLLSGMASCCVASTMHLWC